ncbi:hypothetical protein [Pseudomonas sp.]
MIGRTNKPLTMRVLLVAQGKADAFFGERMVLKSLLQDAPEEGG